jgi:hypothetical protein
VALDEIGECLPGELGAGGTLEVLIEMDGDRRVLLAERGSALWYALQKVLCLRLSKSRPAAYALSLSHARSATVTAASATTAMRSR